MAHCEDASGLFFVITIVNGIECDAGAVLCFADALALGFIYRRLHYAHSSWARVTDHH